MVTTRTASRKRSLLLQAFAISVAFAVGAGVSQVGPIAAASASSERPASAPDAAAAVPGSVDDPSATPRGTVPLQGVDMSKTWTNPIDLPAMAVRTIAGSMPASEANVANAAQIPQSLNQPSWTEANGRQLASRSSQGFGRISENWARTAADYSGLNVDGTMYVYASGAMQGAPNNDRTVWSTTDYLTWQGHEMNLGVVAPTAVQIGSAFYLAGNNTPVYRGDSPTGPWTSMGNFLRPNGQTLSVGDVQFFLDDDGRLYLTWSIGSPIMGAELDPANPRQLISEPVVMWTFDPTQEWQRIGDNRASYTHSYTEGSQLFKVGDTYYLAVASGGTEFTTYATGLQSSDKPLSGFEYTQRNPIGLGDNHPSAVGPNAGHGSFVQDKDGNLLFFYTSVIGYEEFFERRFAMDVCTVSDAGSINCDLTDTPQLAPGHEIDGKRDVGLTNVATNSQLYWTSSYAPGRNPSYGSDRLLSTWWEPTAGDTAPTMIRGFGTVFSISAAQINWKELGRTFTKNNAVRYVLEYKDIPTNTWLPLADRSATTTPRTAEYVTFDAKLTNAVRLRILGTTENITVGVAELNVYGENHSLAVSKGMIVLPPAVEVSAETSSRCVAGKVVLTVRAMNESATAVDLTITSPFGSKSYPAVAPGASVLAAFSTRQTSIPAGNVTVDAAATVAGQPATGQTVSPFAALPCG